MSAGTLNITAEQGATWSLTLTWKIDGAPVDLTGYSARMQVRRTHAAADAILSLTSDDGITLGGEAGTITLTATAAAMAAITARAYVYDLELVSPDGTVTRLVEGTWYHRPEVTR